MARLRDKYKSEVMPQMVEKFGYTTPMQVPKLEKIVLNVGVNSEDGTRGAQSAAEDLAVITGQRPVITQARMSVANFRLRAGMDVGCKVTLRGDRMYEFLDRFISIAVPRIRDFRGLNPNSFDGRGNYALGVREQLIFPEIDYDKIDKIRGMDIIFVTTAETDEEGRETSYGTRYALC